MALAQDGRPEHRGVKAPAASRNLSWRSAGTCRPPPRPLVDDPMNEMTDGMVMVMMPVAAPRMRARRTRRQKRRGQDRRYNDLFHDLSFCAPPEATS